MAVTMAVTMAVAMAVTMAVAMAVTMTVTMAVTMALEPCALSHMIVSHNISLLPFDPKEDDLPRSQHRKRTDVRIP